MNYGAYISAGGALNAMHRLDVATNNLANVNTVAFKRDIANSMPRQTARVEEGLFRLDTNEMLERLGGGVLARPTQIDFGQSAINVTNDDLEETVSEK